MGLILGYLFDPNEGDLRVSQVPVPETLFCVVPLERILFQHFFEQVKGVRWSSSKLILQAFEIDSAGLVILEYLSAVFSFEQKLSRE